MAHAGQNKQEVFREHFPYEDNGPRYIRISRVLGDYPPGDSVKDGVQERRRVEEEWRMSN